MSLNRLPIGRVQSFRVRAISIEIAANTIVPIARANAKNWLKVATKLNAIKPPATGNSL